MLSNEEISRVVAERTEERRRAVFPVLPLGFTFKPDGRSGYIYYKSDGQMMEFYTEMSGVSYYDILIWPDGVNEWCYPDRRPTFEDQRKAILADLRVWLRSKKMRSDLEPPEQTRVI